jgi:hypothetical protein
MLGFPKLDINSDPQLLGAALLKHWELKVLDDAIEQNVKNKRVFVLLKSLDNRDFALFEEDVKLFKPNELTWKWTNETKSGLQGICNETQMCVYRWYPGQKQFFERFKLPTNTQRIRINPVRLGKGPFVDILTPYLR